MNRVILVVIFLFGQSCFAYFDLGLAYSLSSKNSLEQEDESRGVVGLQGSYDWHDMNLGLEYNYFRESADELGLASVSRKYEDLVPWARYNFVNKDKVDVFFGVGSGVYREKIQIDVAGIDSYSGSSELHWLLAGAMGVKVKLPVFKAHVKYLSGGLEYRISRRMAEEQQDQSVRLSASLSFY